MKSKLIFLLLFSVLSVKSDKKVLKQVVILSRHSLRTPLSKTLTEVTPKAWPEWKEKQGDLTQKGAQLEGYMGEYFSSWLKQLRLLPNHCPNKEDLFVYANSLERTVMSAKAFVAKGFPECNITVHHKGGDEMDPLFDPFIHNSTAIFKQLATEGMQALLDEYRQHLNDALADVSLILDFKNSEWCRTTKECDLVHDATEIVDIEPGMKPNLKGPMKICNSVIDAFIMEYYEGMALRDVAWGNLSKRTQWEKLMKILLSYHSVLFNTNLIAKDVSKPLLTYMSKFFINKSQHPKVTLLMGHDSNIYTVLTALNFKPHILKHQYELVPVGSKLVFERWANTDSKEEFLKVQFVYQSTQQLRNGIRLSLQNPAQHQILELESCKVDRLGYCPWKDFVKILKSLNLN